MFTPQIEARYIGGVNKRVADESNKISKVVARPATVAIQALQAEPIFGDEVFVRSVWVLKQLRKTKCCSLRFLRGQLTATVHGTEDDLEEYTDLLYLLGQKAGRLIVNGFPTGVEVNDAIVHGGPFPGGFSG